MCDETPRAELLLPMDSLSPAAARSFGEHSGCKAHALEVLDDALLLISELVTNSVLHGGPPILLAIECDGTALRVHVRDGDAARPRLGSTDDITAEGGRGIPLVELISDTWGVVPVEDDYGSRKEVWFELRGRPGDRDADAREPDTALG